MNKILIIENEYASVKDAFDTANILGFDSSLEIEHIAKSQDVPYHRLNEFVTIFVDISLATKSSMDGYGIITKIKEQFGDFNYHKIVVISGSSKVQEGLENRGFGDIRLLTKPLFFEDLINEIQKRT